LSDEEIQTLTETRAAVSHCPNSNCSIRSGLCDVRRLMEHGVPVGLGTGWTPLTFSKSQVSISKCSSIYDCYFSRFFLLCEHFRILLDSLRPS